MEAIENKWKKLSLSDAGEIGVSCPKDDLPKKIHFSCKVPNETSDQRRINGSDFPTIMEIGKGRATRRYG